MPRPMWNVPGRSRDCDRDFEPWLPTIAKKHSTFYVSLLKKKVGSQMVQQQIPSDLIAQGHLLRELVAILDRRLVKSGHVTATQTLVRLSDSFHEHASWEFWFDLHQQQPEFSCYTW